MKVGYFNVAKNNSEDCFTMIDIKDELQVYYDLIDCGTIDIVTRKVGDNHYNFVVDGEGLLKDNITMGAMTLDCNDGLAGSFIITNSCGPDLTSLTEDDFEYIKRHIGIAKYPNGTKKYMLILNNAVS